MPSVKQRMSALFEPEPTDEFENILLKTIRVPKNMMYLTDRLPKAAYDASPINDASHLSLPSISAKHSATSPGLAYGITGKSGSLSPLRS